MAALDRLMATGLTGDALAVAITAGILAGSICSACRGHGRYDGWTCDACDGTGEGIPLIAAAAYGEETG